MLWCLAMSESRPQGLTDEQYARREAIQELSDIVLELSIKTLGGGYGGILRPVDAVMALLATVVGIYIHAQRGDPLTKLPSLEYLVTRTRDHHEQSCEVCRSERVS